MAGKGTETPHRVTYDRLMVFDHQPRDNQYIYFVKASDAPCIKRAIDDLVLSQAVRKKSRELAIWDPPHRHNVLAKIEDEASDKEARRAQALLQERFNILARKHGKEAALNTVIDEFPTHVRHGIDFCQRGLNPAVNKRVDRTAYIQTTSDGGETGADMENEFVRPNKKAKKTRLVLLYLMLVPNVIFPYNSSKGSAPADQSESHQRRYFCCELYAICTQYGPLGAFNSA